ncbi:MAG: MMPL family transporter [Gammaproteobacteria bacterium]|nr:MMPL family transporter [Gammaproteobacteria bacterium]
MRVAELYQQVVFERPRLVLLFVALLTLASILFAFRFELDASGESLVLENDADLSYYRTVRENYGTDEFLVITYSPHSSLLSSDSLEGIRQMREEVLALENIQTVYSILDVPIIYEAGVNLSELAKVLKTLDSDEIDAELAGREFASNPFYRELLVSKDGKTTALQAVFKFNDELAEMLSRRKQLTELAATRALGSAEAMELDQLRYRIKQDTSLALEQRGEDIKAVREIIDRQRERATLHLGGIPMITTDMIEFIRHDLEVFGLGVLSFLIVILSLFFRQLRWVLLPLVCCSVTAAFMFGFLGLAGWRITVISSNFMSILLIITLSLCVHLIVRFRDLQIESPDNSHLQTVRDTVSSMFRPCFFTIATTIVAFASLIVSKIRPVIDFGWVMIVGLIAAFVLSFILFPTILGLLPPAKKPPARDFTRRVTLAIASLVCRTPRSIIAICLLMALLIGLGMQQLKVENRFIDNFRSSTEIYQGMTVIDQKLGGTTPLEIILDADAEFFAEPESGQDEDFDELFMEDDEELAARNYWLNPTQMQRIKRIQDYLDENPVVGKVLSLATLVRIAEHLNEDELDAFELAIIRKRIPDEFADQLLAPYLSEDANQVRFNVRVIESDHSLNRKQLLEDLRVFLVDEIKLEPAQVHITGMLVLYNNMLQSLFKSQILTLAAVLLAIFLTFVVLFRNVTLALLGIVPNIFSAVMILGITGWLRIPLDMMTITIASITIGIAVDDTIHYIHRLQDEYQTNQDYPILIKRCHSSIGKAMYYTSLAIIFGFAILSFSNFIPTIHFGLLTGLAMLIALIGDLLLLPAMALLIRPSLKT